MSTRRGWPRGRRGRRGFSIMELLIAATLTTVFAGLVGQAIYTTSRAASASAARAVSQTQARQTLDEIERAISSARPLGTCLSPASDSMPLGNCLRVGEKGFALAEATPSRIVLYAYTNSSSSSTKADGTAAGTEILTAPDKVVVEVTDDGLLMVRRYAPEAGATYTNPTYPDLAAAVTVKELSAGRVTNRNLFRYYSPDGELTTNLSSIAMVEADVTVTYRSDGSERTFTLTTTVLLSGAVYGAAS